MNDLAKNKALRERADSLRILPRMDYLKSFCAGYLLRETNDDQLAPIWAEKLRHTYAKVLEITFPELAAANGEVLPIDTSVAPSALEWEQFQIEEYGYADWIDDDGNVMPTSTMTAERSTGRMAEMGHEWSLNWFDLERAAAAGVPLKTMKPKFAKKAHDRFANWVWLFGDAQKGMPGCVTHPNITVTMAALNAGASSRLPANKTNTEIVADFTTLINSVPVLTKREHFIAKVFVSLDLMQLLQDRKLSGFEAGSDNQFVSLWDYIQHRWRGDETGQGKVQFRVLNECDADWRADPRTGTDTSGITGDFMFACPPDSEDNQLIRARSYTQKPPQENGFRMRNMTHSKIGGARIQTPLAFHRMDFGTT